MFRIHHQDKPGTQARTPMCEVRPNLSFPPVSVQVYHLPAEIKVELLGWAGANAEAVKVATASVFVTAGPFDVDTMAEKTVRLDEASDDWFPLATTSDWDSGESCALSAVAVCFTALVSAALLPCCHAAIPPWRRTLLARTRARTRTRGASATVPEMRLAAECAADNIWLTRVRLTMAGLSPNGAIHLVLSCEFHDASDAR